MKGKSLKILVGLLGLLATCLLQSGCYSFSGTVIDYDMVKTFSAEPFENKAPNTPPAALTEFTEKLKDRIRLGTRLKYVDNEGDIQYKGAITRYAISAVAPKPGETIQLQRLTIEVYVEMKNTKQKGQDFQATLPAQWVDFDPAQDFNTIQQQLYTEVFDLLITEIFNRSFSNW